MIIKILSVIVMSAGLALRLNAAPGFVAEAGGSYLKLQHARVDPGPNLLFVDEPSKFAPYVAVTHGFNERWGLRFSYHYVDDARTTSAFGTPPGLPPSPLPVVVQGHYDDDIHVVGLAPEFTWNVSPAVSLVMAPQLNWVASRGIVSYSTTHPAILLVGPRARREEGFTAGGGARLQWSLGRRAALALGYHYLDLSPSFDREAHVISGGLQWRF